jgi:hypothetical protein
MIAIRSRSGPVVTPGGFTGGAGNILTTLKYAQSTNSSTSGIRCMVDISRSEGYNDLPVVEFASVI